MKKNKLLTIGITGMMGSGKSTALNFFNKRGIKTYDLDIEAKKLLKKIFCSKLLPAPNSMIFLFFMPSKLSQ